MAKPSKQFAGDPALVAIGNAIRILRHGKGISQESLAHAAGIDRSYMGGIERGEHNLAMMNLMKIAAQLSVSPSELLEKAGL